MEFCVKYGHLLPSTVDLKLRNGFVVPVELDRSKGVLNGVLCFFKYLKLKGDEWLLFEYSGRYYLNVYIIGSNCSEMNYPDVIDPFKECIPQLGELVFLLILNKDYQHYIDYVELCKVSIILHVCDCCSDYW